MFIPVDNNIYINIIFIFVRVSTEIVLVLFYLLMFDRVPWVSGFYSRYLAVLKTNHFAKPINQ